jgi:hypothetical protein
MSQNTIDPEVNNVICEAVGCYAAATTKITVRVGQKGTISLILCNNCVHKFRDNWKDRTL